MNERAEIFSVIRAGDAERLSELLQQDPSAVHARDENGVSALLQALYQRQPKLARLLLDAHPEPDVFETAAMGVLPRLGRLLEREPGLAQAWSPDGFTALHLACFFGQPDAARILLQHGASPNEPSRNPARLHPVNSAAAARNAAAVRLLLEHGAEVDAAQNGGYTALHSAAHNGDRETMGLLLDAGADPGCRADDGRTPVDMADADGHAELVEILRSRRAP